MESQGGQFKIVIPARLKSSRMPNKPLADIAGKPMVVHAYERAVEAVGADHVIVAVDSEHVANAVTAAGGRAVMTSKGHENGTDRIAEVVDIEGWSDDQIVINLQGDEPLMPPELVVKVGEALKSAPDAGIATLAAPIRRIDDIESPHVVKLVTNVRGEALYFSRATIPFVRDEVRPDPKSCKFLRHIGMYAYRAGTLRQLRDLPPAMIEEAEKLEQLRALYAGITIQVEVTENVPPHGVDTVEMLEAVRLMMEKG